MKYLKDLNKREIIELYNKGFLDTQIAAKLGTNSNVIYNFRRTNNLPSNKGNLVLKKSDLFWKLCRKKTPVKEIAKQLGVSEWTIYDFLHRNNIGFSDFKVQKYKIGKREKSIIIGILLGNGCLSKKKSNNNQSASFVIRHGEKQKLYSEYIYECFRSLLPRIYNVKLKEHRLNNYIISPTVQSEVKLNTHPFLTELYNAFYGTDKKIINFDYLTKYYNKEALAFHFMDDGGTKYNPFNNKIEGFVLCTDSFTIDDVRTFTGFLRGRFNLKCKLTMQNGRPRVYIQKASVNRFIQIVKPYMCESMQYKIRSK